MTKSKHKHKPARLVKVKDALAFLSIASETGDIDCPGCMKNIMGETFTGFGCVDMRRP